MDQNTGGVCDLCDRLRRALGWRHFRTLRRPHRPQVDADRVFAVDGAGHGSGGGGADLQKHRHLGPHNPDRLALHPGRRRWRRMGGPVLMSMEWTRCDRSRGLIASWPRIRGCRAGCPSPTSRCWRSARCLASNSSLGRRIPSRSASFWSLSASAFGSASWKRRFCPSSNSSIKLRAVWQTEGGRPMRLIQIYVEDQGTRTGFG